MSGGYVVYGSNGSSVPTNAGKVIAWNQAGASFNSSGIGTQTLVTINLPAGTFSAAGQSIMVEFWGEFTNTTGDTFLGATFDGNDFIGTYSSGSIPLSATQRFFYFKGMVTCITPVDEFLQNGIASFTNILTGSTQTYIVPQNAGGNPFAGAHQILFSVEGQGTTTAMTIEVRNLLVTFFEDGVNLFP